jgi:hypothetical protein
MFTFLPAPWLAALPALASPAAGAQTGSAPVPATAAEPAAALSYRSAMDCYKPFADKKPVPWDGLVGLFPCRSRWQGTFLYHPHADEMTQRAMGFLGIGASAAALMGERRRSRGQVVRRRGPARRALEVRIRKPPGHSGH